MLRTAGGIISDTLKAYGVTCVFGMEDPIHIFHTLDPEFVRIVTVRDEKHAAIMAHGYAQATGRPGICTSTFGPGATNLITGLLEAERSSVPVIALVQDHGLAVKGKHASSAMDHERSLAPFVKAVMRIDLPEQAEDVIRKAFRISTTGRPGPVAVLCPTDVMAQSVESGNIVGDERYTHAPATRSRPPLDDIASAAALLKSAKRPILVAGGGSIISGAASEIVSLAEKLDAPLATTMTGRGTVADDHPLSVGPLGTSTGGRLGRGRVANEMLAQADVALLMGTRTGQICYSDWTLPGPNTKVIHLDIDPVEVGRNFETEIALVGDVRETLRDLAHIVTSNGAGDRPDPRPEIERLTNEWLADFEPVAASSAQPIRPERLLSEISALLDEKSLLVTDASYITGWAMSHIDVPASGRFILSPRGTGGIGWCLPAAIGAKLADPSRSVICMSGDGAFGYVINELETAARVKVPLVVVVFNNATLGFQRHWEQKVMGSYRECDFLDVDYSEVGRALKCQGERVTDPGEIKAAIERGLAANAPYVVDVVIDADATAPIVGFETVLAADAAH
ncbi:thiamine pyrophosphate-dependent enzyme [Mesorhizobium sp. Z1-4]|uniref:thiamine pyrophosphate-binding protein n=1 Tax=Mesorhizobium sp. Z1-4 TaxID=2448478 RepID=UPI000FD91D26|nr:thiamine pyrophosphate-dependent enzyme [Mesorhizobium sp. Z1-4]